MRGKQELISRIVSKCWIPTGSGAAFGRQALSARRTWRQEASGRSKGHGIRLRSRLATTHHSFLGSFSAGSKRNLATKHAFFQVFRDLQNYLADFLKKLQKFAKNRKKLQILRNFRIFAKKVLIFAKIADFLQILQDFLKFSQIVLYISKNLKKMSIWLLS